MTPLILYVLFAGGMAFAVHKQKWGIAAFCAAALLWMMVTQIVIALMSRSTTF